MYGIFSYIYHKNEPNVGKYTSPMDPMGTEGGTILDILGTRDPDPNHRPCRRENS